MTKHRRGAKRLTHDGYAIQWMPNHPIAQRAGRVRVGRMVLFDQIGYGPHVCHWCGKSINWGYGLEVDHVDFQRTNDDPSNLVRSCGPCNVKRQDRTQTTYPRAVPPLKDHCPAGHPYVGDNLYIVPCNGKRRCRQCQAAWHHQRWVNRAA